MNNNPPPITNHKYLDDEYSKEKNTLHQKNQDLINSLVDHKIDIYALLTMLYAYTKDVDFSEIEILTNKTVLKNMMRKYSTNTIDDLQDQFKKYMKFDDDNLLRNAPQVGPIQ